MTSSIEAVYNDALKIWELNNFENSELNCDCADLLHVWLHVLDPTKKAFPDYRMRKAKQAIPIIISKSSEILSCGHKWSCNNCNQYINEIEQLLILLKKN